MANAWVPGRLINAYRVDGWSGKLADQKIDSEKIATQVFRTTGYME